MTGLVGLLTAMVPAGVAGASSHKPKITRMVATPSPITSGSDTVVTATVANAASCTLATAPAASWGTGTVACSGGTVSQEVGLPINSTSTVEKYKVTLTAVGTSASKSKTITVKVEPGAGTGAPTITGVRFSGNSVDPTITLSGTGFGSGPPTGFSDDDTSCGTYSGNGETFGTNLYIQSSTFVAGEGTPPSTSCVGLVVQSWTDTQIVMTYGSAYDTYGPWVLNSGDSYTAYVEGASYAGTVEFG